MRDDSIDASLRLILKEEISGLAGADFSEPFERLAVDSFGFVALRARLEQCIGRQISDELWTSARTPADLLRICNANGIGEASSRAGGMTARSYTLNMPQMAMEGLSESWLFKELGDLHWQMITDGLQCPSSALLDGNGNRLYATFTRISLSVDPLASYRENGLFTLAGSISRFGAGMFFSDIRISPNCHARMMSSFSMRGESGSNRSLLKGQPSIPQDCDIAELATLPEFAQEYRVRRDAALSEPLFTHEYEIVPPHDINGVGLLYFAAYPTISDICLAKFADQWRHSTCRRDVYYFGNCDRDETLVFRLHRLTENHDGIGSETSISRKSDGALMAYLITQKAAQ